jgi:heme/copper-type cytochrome/quinol oxidase subunit 4
MSVPIPTKCLRSCIFAYTAILAITGLQIVAAYIGASTAQHVIEMLTLCVIQAGLAISLFMRMLEEDKRIMVVLIASIFFVLLVMNCIWSDSFRMIHMRPWPN